MTRSWRVVGDDARRRAVAGLFADHISSWLASVCGTLPRLPVRRGGIKLQLDT